MAPPRPNLTILRAAAGVVVLGIVLVGGYGLWYLFLKPAGPAPVGAATAPFASLGSAVPVPATADGTWKVDTSIGSLAAGTSSFVGYRVQEQLAGIGGNTAVWRTADVSGTLTVQGTTVTAAEITANLASLKSDDDRRDNQLRHQALETDQFPTAMFSLTEPIELGSLPQDGATFSATAKGKLTLHGVTKPISIDLNATRNGGMLSVTGSTSITFADFGIQKPTSFAVLSVDDYGIMELQLHFGHA